MMHTGAALFHHHFMATFRPITTMVSHPADATTDEADKKDESHDYKEPRDKDEDFAGYFFPELCKQQGTCKDR